MIDSLIKKIKNKFSKSEYDEEEYDEQYEEDEYEEDEYEEEEENEEEENENLDDGAKKNNKNNKKVENEDEEEDEEEGEEEDEEEDEYEDEDESKNELSEEEKKTKDKKSKIIQIFAFVVIAYVFLTWEEDSKKEKKGVTKKSEKLVKKKKKRKAKTIVKKVKSPESKKDLSKKNDPMALLEEDSPELDGSDFGLGDDFLTNEKPKSIIKKPKKVEQEIIEEEKITSLDKREKTNVVPEERNPASMVVSKPSILKESLIKKIKKKKDSYTEPPNYSFRGRGLVYNCKGKHWACVDKESYLKCRANEKWQKNKNKKTECKTINVYLNIKDCSIIQLNNIHTLVKTDFCKN